MFYQKLANEYSSEAKKLGEYIHDLRRQHSRELALSDFKICKRLSTLYSMYLDLKHMGNFLKLRSERRFYGKIN